MRSPTSPSDVGTKLAELAHEPDCAPSVTQGVEHLRQQFSRANSPGVNLAVTALAGALPESMLRSLAPSYMAALLAVYEGQTVRS